MNVQKATGQFVKFAVVGLINTAIDWICFFLLKLIPFFLENRPYAKAISFIFAAINSFFLNSNWTFKEEYKSGFSDNDQAKLKKNSIYFGRFLAVSLIGWVINTGTYTIVINNLPGTTPEKYSDLIALVLATAAGIIWNFFANKFWTYNKIKQVEASKEEKIKRRYFNLIGFVLLAVMATISFMVMKDDSGIVDEVAHIPAGYGYVKYFDYRLNPEHPPLAKAIAALPLAFQNLTGLEKSAAWNDINQWESGWDFIYRLGNDSDKVLMYSRLPMIGLLLVLGFFLYRFAAEKFGRRTAVLVLTLFCFYPDFLAHGHLVTTDVAAALGFLIAVYYFDHWVNDKIKKNLLIAGIAFGIAQLLKFSAVLLLPIYIFYISFRAEKEKAGSSYWSAFWRLFKSTFYICLIGLGTIYLVYLPLVWNTPSSIEHSLIEKNLTIDARTLPFRTFLHAFEGNPFLRALGHYILGIFLVFGRVGGGNSTYILGHFSDKGISWFFPAAWLIKTPLSIIILFFSSIVLFFYKKAYKTSAWLSVVFLTPIAIYWAVTLKGSLNIGIRHLMPTVPFVLLFIGMLMRPYLITKFSYKQAVIGALCVWLVVSSLIAFPKYMSYFNEYSIGKNKYDLMVDSSLDWGQDLKRLATYVKENNITDIKVDYFGGSVPENYISGVQKWRSGNGPTTGYLAVSATFYQFSKLYGPQEGKWSYEWLESYKPTVIGDSILLFHITPEDLATNPPKSPYPITKYDPIEISASPTHAIN